MCLVWGPSKLAYGECQSFRRVGRFTGKGSSSLVDFRARLGGREGDDTSCCVSADRPSPLSLLTHFSSFAATFLSSAHVSEPGLRSYLAVKVSSRLSLAPSALSPNLGLFERTSQISPCFLTQSPGDKCQCRMSPSSSSLGGRFCLCPSFRSHCPVTYQLDHK